MTIKSFRYFQCPVLQFCVIIICLIYGEIIHPYISLNAWRLPDNKPSDDEVRILLIADSHIEGYHSDLWIFNDILQADSDDYLRFYFLKAVQGTNSNGVLFLGDVLDTGDIALNEDFTHATSRFRKIFLSEKDLFVILTPGDNDIGGEGNPVTKKTLTRFFANLPVKYGNYKYKFVNFYSDYRKPEIRPKISNENSSDEINVYVSHFPVISHEYVHFPLNLLKANASLSIHGHLHRSQIIHWKNTKNFENAQSNVEWIQTPQLSSISSQPLSFKLNDSLKLLEIQNKLTHKKQIKLYGELISIGVPSCTYRSGYPQITGIGLLQLYQNKSIIYTVLPLYNRYCTIFIYCLLITLLIGLKFIFYCTSISFKFKYWQKIFLLIIIVLILLMIYIECDIFARIGKLF
ncbi:unnamed protein product [Schistosoma rodhaini]|uniref:Calcineurin-like phosphoesterase domain-containing protein n=1 Tax=Schistosoma rodhaini TaxID=6188 RepID=A0AA85EL53_9TREM|nr:unnamed protein product [Schistosoma rodhaini]CAH8679209.1 unnamed protein product [Schistosoma rodhaini]